MKNWLVEIENKLATATDDGRQPFGFEKHEFYLYPPADSEFVQFIEESNGIRLPDDYREFILELGDGGAGPAYGLNRFLTAISEDRLDKHLTTILGMPFPHEQDYAPQTDPKFTSYYDPDHGGSIEISPEHSEWHYYNIDLVAGTIVLCDEGCGYQHRLVVNGPSYGEIWMDNRSGDGGFNRLCGTFTAWYTRWLNNVVIGGKGTWWFENAG